MIVTLSTDLLPIVVPDTYGSRLQNDIRDDCWDELKSFMVEKAGEYIKEALEETDLSGAKLIMGKFYSPKWYNFGTDWILFDLEIPNNYTDMIKSKIDTAYMDWVRENFHSYDGYLSWVPQTREDMFKALDSKPNEIHHPKEIAIATWLRYQLKDYPDQQHDYFEDIWEKCSQDGWDYDDEDDEYADED